MTDTKIIKVGHGNYIAKCNECGWREEIKGSLATTKGAVMLHVGEVHPDGGEEE